MFHYKAGHPDYNVGGHAHLFVKRPDNFMINKFGMFILSEFPKMQNMRSFVVVADTDIDVFVRDKKELQDGTIIYRFSKELLAYLETLVAFSPYYRVNDPRAAGPMDTYYAEALQAYSVISYDTFHNMLAKEMKAWYDRFPPVEEEVETDSEGEPREPPVVTGVPAPSVMLSFAVDDDCDVTCTVASTAPAPGAAAVPAASDGEAAEAAAPAAGTSKPGGKV